MSDGRSCPPAPWVISAVTADEVGYWSGCAEGEFLKCAFHEQYDQRRPELSGAVQAAPDVSRASEGKGKMESFSTRNKGAPAFVLFCNHLLFLSILIDCRLDSKLSILILLKKYHDVDEDIDDADDIRLTTLQMIHRLHCSTKANVVGASVARSPSLEAFPETLGKWSTMDPLRWDQFCVLKVSASAEPSLGLILRRLQQPKLQKWTRVSRS